MRSVYLSNESATLALGAKIAPHLNVGDVIALRGELGAGKTTFARGLIKALTDETEVPSPTYTLVQVYEADRCEIWHCDMYRLERPEDGIELGLLDAFEDAICVIEWPDKLGGFLPKNALNIDIVFKGEGREVHFTGWETRIDNAIT